MKKFTILILTSFFALALCFANDDANEKTKAIFDDMKAAITEGGGKAVEAISEGFKKAGNSIKEEVNRRDYITVVGKLKVFSNKEKTSFQLITEDKDIFTLETITNSEDSLNKLKAHKGLKLTVTGILNKETKSIKMTNYELYYEKSKKK